MEKQRDRSEDGDVDHVLQPRYEPVLELATGLAVGAELVAPRLSPDTRTTGSAAWAGSPPMTTRLAAHEFAFGPAADEGWWLAAGLGPDQAAASGAVQVVADLLRSSGLPPERLLLPVTHAELSRAVRSGSARDLARIGVRFTVTDFAAVPGSSALLRSAPVASIQVSLLGLGGDADDRSLIQSIVALAGSCGTEVIGADVETAEQVALAGGAGVNLVRGYWWGSPGPLAKLVNTWGRFRLSE